MPASYDPLRDPMFVIGDHDASLPFVKRSLWRGVVLDGSSQKATPLNKTKKGYLFRHAVTIPRRPPRTAVPVGGQNNQPSLNPEPVRYGAFGFAIPVIAQGLPGAVNLMPLLGNGLVDDQLAYIDDATLPDGTQEFVRGDSGVLVAGLDADRERRVFISTRAMLYSHHNQPGASNPNNTNLSTRVYDTDGDVRGPWAGLHRGLMVTSIPEPWLTDVVKRIRPGLGMANMPW